jgi:3-deoxy-D-manno-octulosonic-acid transferase
MGQQPSRLEWPFRMYLLYSTLLAIALLLASPYWIFEALRHGKYRKGLSERLGHVPARLRNSGRRSIWVHAVSVGEVLAVSEIARTLRSEFPEYRVVVSTTTDTGQQLAASRFGAENVFYFPFDFAFSVRRWLAALRPRLIVIAETEFWPNFLRLSKAAGAHIAVVNARISDRSLPGYRRWSALLRQVVRPVNVFLAQTGEDARRLAAIGAPAEKVLVAGNLKYDVLSPPELPIVRQLRAALQQSAAGPVLVCGSTVEGEEQILSDAFKKLRARHSNALMLLAPRHPERFSEVAAILKNSEVRFRRRSEWNGEPLAGGVLLIDTIGELSSLYALADIAFVGGSLVPRGGHNIIEPAQHGVAILVGEHTENFRDIIDLFKSRDAVRIARPENLAATFLRLLADNADRRELGRRAAETLASQRGATEFTMARLRELLLPAREVTPA